MLQIILHQLVLDAALLCLQRTADSPPDSRLEVPEKDEKGDEGEEDGPNGTSTSISPCVDGDGSNQDLNGRTDHNGPNGSNGPGGSSGPNTDLSGDPGEWNKYMDVFEADVCWAEDCRDMYLEEAVQKLAALSTQWQASLPAAL